MMSSRTATVSRRTRETDIEIEIDLDGSGNASVETGIGFFDHMLEALILHARIDAGITCRGDLEVDDHHTVEDTAIALGEAIGQALGDRSGIRRFASAYAPLDEALCRAAIDISGRPGAWIDIPLRRDRLGGLSCENIPHFFSSLATSMRATLHVDLLRGENGHHIAEAAFKATALALREAVRIDGDRIASTKGTL